MQKYLASVAALNLVNTFVLYHEKQVDGKTEGIFSTTYKNRLKKGFEEAHLHMNKLFTGGEHLMPAIYG